MAAVAQTIATRAHTGHSRFDIRLDPAELGSVDVRVEVRSNGEVRAHLVVERTETLDLMLRDQKNLERSLADAGLDVGSSGLQFSLKEQTTGQGGQGWRTYDEAATRPDPAADAEADAAAQSAALAYRPARSGGVDLRV
jgi:flagellar hook-length control protein FliK